METNTELHSQDELRLQLLGGLSITLGGAVVRGFLSSKVQALLCYLAATGRTHSRESLIALLWGDMPEERASHGLRQALSNLQKLVGSHLLITRPTVAFDLTSPHHVDTESFLALIKQADDGGRRSAGSGVHRRLRQAVSLYTGDFLDGFYARDAPDFDEWAAAMREQLRRMALDALHKLAGYHSARAEYSTAAGYLRQLLNIDPWQEDGHRRLMLTLAYEGKPDAAIAQYRICRRVFSEEFGEEPSEETTLLYNRIRAGDIEPPPTHASPGNLPAQVERLVGRSADLTEVATLLEDPNNRLLTLIGSGGVGKTTLALHIARETEGDFEHGVFFVPLASISDPDLLLSAIADVLGIETAPERTMQQSIKLALRDKQMLLVLDNFEHLLASAPHVTALVSDLPRLRVLVTSRTSLHIRGERIYEVVPLALPPLQDPAIAEVVSGFPAAALFAERALSARPDFAITDANARVVAEICHRLEGLPLAIELAAARLNIMPAQALLARLSNRLGILTGGARDLPKRQQAVRDTIAWSHDLLSLPQKDLFARLSIFADGCNLEAVEAICRSSPEHHHGTAQPIDVLENLSALVDSSLVKRHVLPGNEERFGMLEMVREYALERLSETEEIVDGPSQTRRQHALHYLNMVLTAKPDLQGPRQKEWLDRFDTERGNLRAALTWARDGGDSPPDLELALSSSAALMRFWQSRGQVSEGRQWLESLLARPGSVTPIRAEALRAAGVLAFSEGDLEGSANLCEKSLELYSGTTDELGLASVLINLGNARREQGAYDRAVELYTQGLTIFRALDDTLGISVTLNNLGATLQHQGNFLRASALYEESLVLRRSAEDTLGIAYTLYKIAEVTRDLGNYARAISACEESMSICLTSGDKQGQAMSILTLGTIRQAEGDASAASSLFEDSLARFTDMADRWGIATAKHKLGSLAHAQGNYEQAQELYQDSLNLYRDNGDKRATAAVLSDLSKLTDILSQHDYVP